LWTKGEESGNYLYVKEILEDCDKDTLLVKAVPAGPACHTGTDTCWGEKNERFESQGFTAELERVIEERRGASPESSYTAKLLAAGPRKIAKKLGEESAELIIESMDTRDDLFLNEAADLLYHYLVLVHSRGYALKDVEDILRERHR
jgi:phosphoribosyl-ATP pyrophosphohydrolase/phosphoribosyl-AMP cyclohydrolase